MRKSHEPRLSGYTKDQTINHYTTHNQIYGRKSRNSMNCRDIAIINLQNSIQHHAQNQMCAPNDYVSMKLNRHYETDN